MEWIYAVLTLVLASPWVQGEGNDVVYMHEKLNQTEDQPSLCPELPQCKCLSKEGKETIDCSNRELSQLPRFAVLSGKQYDTILLNNNKFSHIRKGAFDGLNVRRLVMSNNTLRSPSDKGFNELYMLEELIMDNCSLSSTPIGFNALSRLRHLELQNNKILQIHTKTFEEMEHLEYMDLSGNPIVITAPFVAFQPLKRVKKLFMEDCGLYSIPRDAIGNMTKLTDLNLSRNKIWTIPNDLFKEMTDLVTLDLSENPIQFDSKDKIFGSLNKLTALKLGGCKCKDKRLHKNIIANLKRLKTLMIRSCDIHQIEESIFSHLNELKELDLGGNHFILKSDVFKGVTDTVEKLYLDDAGLDKFPYHIFEHFSKLKHVYLRENQMESLSAQVFRTLAVDGVHVYLQHNKIKKISSKVLQWSPRPIHLHLEHNRLKTLSFIEKEPCFFQLGTLYLEGNNLSCCCMTFKAVQMKAFTLVGQCTRPNEFQGLHLSWQPDYEEEEQLYLEHNVTSCKLPDRRDERFECTCRKWMEWDSAKRCGEVGAAGRPTSFVASPIIIAIISFLAHSYLR